MLSIESEMILLRGGKFRRLEDGVIVGWPTPLDMTLADAKEIVMLFWRLEPRGRFRILIDQRGVTRKVEGVARDYLASELESSIQNLAIITGNTISRFFASGILATMGMGKKARAFDSEEAALSWI